MKFLGEFKEFINRGNVMDLAVAVIIGGAFASIVTALTTNIINPLISVVAGGSADAVSDLVVLGTEIDFGAFISACINFLIVAFVVFLFIKAVNKAQDLGNKIAKTEKKEKSLLLPARSVWRKLRKAQRAALIARARSPARQSPNSSSV